MDYNFIPFGALNTEEFYINPENLISLEDFCVLIENNAPFYIANYIKEYGLQLYYHRDFIKKDGREKMICRPLKFIQINTKEYKFVCHRLYFLKRDINKINANYSIKLLPDNILESANSQICNSENKTKIAKLSLEKIEKELIKVKKSPTEEFLLMCGALLLLVAMPLRYFCWWIMNNNYLEQPIPCYNGKSLKALDEKGAMEIIQKVLKEHSITLADFNTETSYIRALLALELHEGGITNTMLGELLHPTTSTANRDSKARKARDWVKEGKAIKENNQIPFKKAKNSLHKSPRQSPTKNKHFARKKNNVYTPSNHL